MKKLTLSPRSKWSVFVFLAMIMFTIPEACYYDNEEELYPDGCRTTNITYQGFIRPFIDANCSCHLNGSADGGVILQSYITLKTYVNNGKLLRVLKHEPGVVGMPQGLPKKSDCEISKVEAWINAGALEN